MRCLLVFAAIFSVIAPEVENSGLPLVSRLKYTNVFSGFSLALSQGPFQGLSVPSLTPSRHLLFGLQELWSGSIAAEHIFDTPESL
jgi:hypothetical protein